MLKPEIRIVAWDDCAFRFGQRSVRLIGAVFRGSVCMDGMLSVRIAKDGMDATERIAARIRSSRQFPQLSYILLNGITFGGLNVVDIAALSKKAKLPAIAVQRRPPDKKKFTAALRRLPHAAARIASMRHAGPSYRFRDISYQMAGCSTGEAKELLSLTCTRSSIPEPLRVAHLIASGLSGESRGGA